MEKMSRTEEQDILSSLNKVVGSVRTGADAGDAIAKVAGEKGYGIQKIARMCEAYNKSKSIYLLSKRAQTDRAEDFPLVDTDQVVRKLFAPVEKTAGLGRIPDLSMADFEARRPALEKAAAENIREEKIDTGIPRYSGSVLREVDTRYQHWKLAADNAGKASREARLRIDLALLDIKRSLLPETETGLRKIAGLVYSKYGDKGGQLMKLACALMGRECPRLEKTAQTAVFRKLEPYLSIGRAMDAFREYHAAEQCKESLQKEALNFATSMLSNIAAGTTQRAVMPDPDMPDLVSIMAYNAPIKTKEVLDPRFSNKLEALDTTDLFYDIYSEDEFLKNQPIDLVMKSFNKITQMLPDLPNRKNAKALITSLVKRTVASGGDIDPAEAAQYTVINKMLSESASKRMQEARDKAEALKPVPLELPVPNIPQGTPSDTKLFEGLAGALAPEKKPAKEAPRTAPADPGRAAADTARAEHDRIRSQVEQVNLLLAQDEARGRGLIP
jgi:hypothetical protein